MVNKTNDPFKHLHSTPHPDWLRQRNRKNQIAYVRSQKAKRGTKSCFRRWRLWCEERASCLRLFQQDTELASRISAAFELRCAKHNRWFLLKRSRPVTKGGTRAGTTTRHSDRGSTKSADSSPLHIQTAMHSSDELAVRAGALAMLAKKGMGRSSSTSSFTSLASPVPTKPDTKVTLPPHRCFCSSLKTKTYSGQPP